MTHFVIVFVTLTNCLNPEQDIFCQSLYKLDEGVRDKDSSLNG